MVEQPKIGPEVLASVLSQLPKNENNNNLLVGLDTADDAAVYKLNDETALIQTLDFFTPMIDDPYIFGQIAAANSLSDVYAREEAYSCNEYSMFSIMS